MLVTSEGEQHVWKALSNPVRRRLLDLMRDGPRSTGELAESTPELSRFAVMQHLEVLTDAGLVVVRRRGRQRFNHLNPAVLRDWYERWVTPMADQAAGEMISLRHHVEKRGIPTMSSYDEPIRTVRIETELRFEAGAERVFDAITKETLEWFPQTFGEDRVQGVVVEPRVGGAVYENWGDGAGYLYGLVTVYDPPQRYATRGHLDAGTILDTDFRITQENDASLLQMSKVIVGPLTEEEAGLFLKYGDIAHFEDALRSWIEGK